MNSFAASEKICLDRDKPPHSNKWLPQVRWPRAAFIHLANVTRTGAHQNLGPWKMKQGLKSAGCRGNSLG